ncbi:MJ0042 family finger-like domain-containing protein [Trichlorobacter thiogenes]|uniref:MJ0042 family finger-like domain-containing protein n=1 Tax=Trichlorobacter thiogenes TaxID=115783 RepID=A0A1T4RRL7_9BACT|nr:DUF3426 domain-containing protein [Trichlorobacter thiogenes]SKA18665.1 MJ0042 family finger-like domain-containing protein [Trichlorobacter thiogenes]
MIIQCEQCRTKFKLDDERVSDRGVKVRCAKCRHIFTVRKDVGQASAPVEVMPDLAAVAMAAPVAAADETVRMSFTPAPEPEVTAFAAEPEVAFDFGAAPVEATPATDTSFSFEQAETPAASDFDFGDVSFTTETPAATPAAADFGEMTMVMPPKQAAEQPAEFGFDFGAAPVAAESAPVDTVAFDFGDAFAPGADVTAQTSAFDFGDQGTAAVAASGEIDLGGFDFGDAPAVAAAPTSIDTTDFSNFTAASTTKSAVAESSFSFDEVAPQSTATSGDSFDFSGVDFGDGQTTTKTAAAPVEAFSLGEMDFSGDTAAVAVDATATAPAGSTLFAPVDESVARQQEPVKPDISFDAPAGPEELPPSSITSRRRQGSSMSILIAVITILVLGVLGYIAYTFIGNDSKAVSLFGKPGVAADDGKITVQNVKAYFIPKATAGELLVITGEALNGYKKPRAALQVKGMVFGATNQAVATKTAYAGNQLTKEQLAEMPADKIEAAMNNQFGDSLTNLEVQPGKTIPFTIIIINPPTDGKDFGVEPVGSTVATAGK